jgi:hypothetical protein
VAMRVMRSLRDPMPNLPKMFPEVELRGLDADVQLGGGPLAGPAGGVPVKTLTQIRATEGNPSCSVITERRMGTPTHQAKRSDNGRLCGTSVIRYISLRCLGEDLGMGVQPCGATRDTLSGTSVSGTSVQEERRRRRGAAQARGVPELGYRS